MQDYKIEVRSEVSDEGDALSRDARAVLDGLIAYNRQFAPEEEYTLLRVFLRDEQGRIAGGLLGDTSWGWLHVGIFWLEESVRRRGYGSQLLAVAEAEAMSRGCGHAYLDTLDFQALPFYEKRGYGVYATLQDFPLGHERYYLKKDLG